MIFTSTRTIYFIVNAHSDVLSLSFSLDQGDNVVRALQGMLQQAKVALKPGNKPSKSRPSTSPPAAAVDKRALACGIIALLQHSCTPAAATATVSATDLSNLISEALVDGMRQQPWLWERFVRQHLDYLLQTPEAVDLLTFSLNHLDAQVVSRSWAVLSSQLRHVDPMTLCSAPALGNFQRAALNQVSSCFRLISRDVLPNIGTGTAAASTAAASAGAGGIATAGVNTTSEVDITLSLQLPAALYTLLYLVGVTDQQGGSSSSSDRGCVEGAAAYTSMLLKELCTPESVYKMLNLENLHIQQQNNKATAKEGKISKEKAASKKKKKGKSDEKADEDDDDKGKEEEDPKLSLENVAKIYTAMHTTTVLIEAVLTSPQLAQELLSADATTTSMPSQSHSSRLTKIAVLLSIRWELAQLLAAAGITPGSSLFKSFTKSAPPLWSPQTCAAILDLAVVVASSGGGEREQQQSHSAPAVTLPPAMLAHALELIQDALIANKTTFNEDSVQFLAEVLQQVMHVQEACATGVLTPHAAVHAGPGHHVALTAARKLHSLLLSEDTPAATEKKSTDPKKRGQGGAAVAAASKRRKKGGDGDGHGQDEVADLMRMFTSGSEPLPEPTPTKETTIATVKIAVGGGGGVAGVDGSIKPVRKRITPQAIEPTVDVDMNLFGVNGAMMPQVNDDEEEEEEEAAPGAGAGGVGYGGGTFGRVVMASTLDMDDATREAAWQAYIADKEKLVDMLGVRNNKNYFFLHTHTLLPLEFFF